MADYNAGDLRVVSAPNAGDVQPTDDLSVLRQDRTYRATVSRLLSSAVYTAPYADAQARSLEGKLGEIKSVLDFDPNANDGVTDARPAFLAAADAGGLILVPSGTYRFAGTLTIGNGSNDAPSSIHQGVIFQGEGRRGTADVTNVFATAPTILLYDGATSTSAAVIEFAGPLVNIGLRDLTIDCADKAGTGVRTNHVSGLDYGNVEVRRYTTLAWDYTTRDGFPSGCAYGCGNGIALNCSAYEPTNATADAIRWTSGVSGTLVGNPDTANLTIQEGVYLYGGGTGSAGLRVAGADNNILDGAQLLPSGGNTGGSSIVFEQWAASPQWPHENVFVNYGHTQNVTGTSGTGGNVFYGYQTSDGAAVPSLAYVNTYTCDGKEYASGARVYRSRVLSASINGAGVSTSSTSYSDVTGLTLTTSDLPAASRLRITYTGRASKATAGTGSFQIKVDATEYGESLSMAGATGFPSTVAGSVGITNAASGTHQVSLEFKSSDANDVTIFQGVLTVEELV